MTKEEALDKLRAIQDGIKPNIVMGDNDSVSLTPTQVGKRSALSTAIRIVEKIVIEPVTKVSPEHFQRMAVAIHGECINKYRYVPEMRRAQKEKTVETCWRNLTPAERRGIMDLCLKELLLEKSA